MKAQVLDAAYHSSFDDFTKTIDGRIQSAHTTHKKRLDSLISENVQFFDTEVQQLFTAA